MKKITACFLSVAVIVMSSTGMFYAENQDGQMQPVATPTIQAIETNLPSSTTSDPNSTDTSVTPSPTPVPTESIQIPGLTDDVMFNDLLSKKQTLDDLVSKENQICEMIKEQDAYNLNITSVVSVVSQTYSSPYLKIIDDIKILLTPVKEKMVLNSIELGKIKSKATVAAIVTPTATPTAAVKGNQKATPSATSKVAISGNQKAISTATPTAPVPATNKVTPTGVEDDDGSSLLEKEVNLSYNQLQGLNMAIKGLRESLKFISVENNEITRKINEGQSQINKINNSIADINKKIIEDKLLKDKEWESFCDAMYKKDLKVAYASYDNMILIKERMVKNYQTILLLKKKIEQILVPLETL